MTDTDVTSTSITATEVTTTEVTSTSITNTDVTTTDTTATTVTATDVTTTDTTATTVTVTEITSTSLTATDVTSTSVTATDVTATDTTATTVTATDVTSTSVTATDITSTSVTATDVTSTDITRTFLTRTSLTATSITATEVTSTTITATTTTTRPPTAAPTVRCNGRDPIICELLTCVLPGPGTEQRNAEAIEHCPNKCDPICGGTIAPTTASPVPAAPGAPCISENVCETGQPGSILVRYSPQTGSSNQQGSNAVVIGEVAGTLQTLVCTDIQEAPASNINVNDVIVLSPSGSEFNNDTTCLLYGAGESNFQAIQFHTSCSSPLNVGDVFGSFEVIGYDGDIHCDFTSPTPRESVELCSDVDVCADSAPSVIELRYSPGSVGVNFQGSESAVSGDASSGNATDIICLGVGGEGHHYSNVGAGDTIVVGSIQGTEGTYLGGVLSCTIFSDGARIEFVTMQTSCESSLTVGDGFGSLTIVGYDNHERFCDAACSACDSSLESGTSLSGLEFEYTAGDEVMHNQAFGSVIVAGSIGESGPVSVAVVSSTTYETISDTSGVVVGQIIPVPIAATTTSLTIFIYNDSAQVREITDDDAVSGNVPLSCDGIFNVPVDNVTVPCTTPGISFPSSCANSLVRAQCARSCCDFGYPADYSQHRGDTPPVILSMVTIDVTCNEEITLGAALGPLIVAGYSRGDGSRGSLGSQQQCLVTTGGETFAPTSAPTSNCRDTGSSCPVLVASGACVFGHPDYTVASAECQDSCALCRPQTPVEQTQLIAEVSGTQESEKSCAELQALADQATTWKVRGQVTDSTVCGASKNMQGECLGDHGFGSALRQCSAMGARLCTPAEIQVGEVEQTGCGSGLPVWSSEPCSVNGNDGLFVSTYNSFASTCGTQETGTIATVRCCADVVIGSPLEIFFVGANINATNENQWLTAVQDLLTIDQRRERRALVNDPTDILLITTSFTSDSVTVSFRTEALKQEVQTHINDSPTSFCVTVNTGTFCGSLDNNEANSGGTSNSDGALLGSNSSQGLTIAAFVLIAAVVAVAALVAVVRPRHADHELNSENSSAVDYEFASAVTPHARRPARQKVGLRVMPSMASSEGGSLPGIETFDALEDDIYSLAAGDNDTSAVPAPWEWMDMLRDPADEQNPQYEWADQFGGQDQGPHGRTDVTYDYAAQEEPDLNDSQPMIKRWDYWQAKPRPERPQTQESETPRDTDTGLEWDGSY
eukprot:m.139721 g.139721  ORF g.139721 m.139721 type:complete len:1227 (+) comp11508_c0_seq1:2-3682(+)